LDFAWRHDCKIRSGKDKPWIHREEYRNLFETLLDLEIASLHPTIQDAVKDYDIEIPNEMMDSIQDAINLELDLNEPI